MSERYPGGFIVQNPPAPSVAAAPGVWTLEQAAEYIRAGTWPYPPQPDAQWNYVTALFAGTSTNGAQNNTFVDSSSNGFTITRNGNTTQGSFTPYQPEGYWSNYFDGNGDYLTVADAAALDFGTGDFTIEFWAYFDGAITGDTVLLEKRASIAAVPWIITADATNGGTIYFYDGTERRSTVVIPVNTWTYFMFTRQSGTLKIFVNGIEGFSGTVNTNLDTTGNLFICARRDGAVPFKGYLSNLRLLKGTGYSSSTVPTAPLTAITNTSLLTCQSNRFRDASTNNFAITVNGNTSVQDFAPVSNPNPYSPQTVGGSGYFDGSGDYLEIASATELDLRSGDFTIEAWVYTASTSSIAAIYGQWRNTQGILYFVSGKLAWAWAPFNIAGALLQSTTDVPLNAWTHCAVTRSGNTWRLFINGALEASATYSGNATAAAATTIGAYIFDNPSPSATGFFTGYISNLRIVKGTAVYTAAFTPPTSPLTAISGTALLANFTNAGIFDAAAANNAETVGNAQVSTTVVKYGPSLSFDGSGDWLKLPNSQNYNFGSGNFTIEGWVYCTNTSPRQDIFTSPANGSGFNGVSIEINNGQFELVLSWTGGWDVLFAAAGAIAANTWTHFALTRAGSRVTFFVNGNQTYTTTAIGTSSLVFGTDSAAISYGRVNQSDNRFLFGYLYNFRITKGYARYWYPFTPPLVPMGTYYAPEVLPAADPLFDYVTMLLPGNGTNGAQNNTFQDSSTNNFTITRNGNVTQGTFSPYGDNWSNSFTGVNGQNLSIATNAALDLTGDFTIECWVYPNSLPPYSVVWDTSQSGFFDSTMSTFGYDSSGSVNFYAQGGALGLTTANNTVIPNVWTHIAITRSGNTYNVWVNGTSRATGSYSGGLSTGYTWRIGDRVASAGSGNYPVNGYISNFRAVKGTAVYTTAFTPPTAPLTAISGTSLLTCQSNRFRDASSNNFAITRNGNVSVQRFSPFAPTAAYSAATIGGSGYFDGSGDYLVVGTGSNLGVGSSDFTIELWWYPTAWSSGAELFSAAAGDGTNRAFAMYTDGSNGTLKAYAGTGGSSWDIVNALSMGTAILNQWNHMAFTRSGSTFATFLNGVRIATTTASGTMGSKDIGVGAGYTGATIVPASWIANCRVIAGTALYTGATYTVPTTPLTAVSGTRALLNFTNAGIIDNAMMNDLETVGNAQISTSVSKFGGSSMSFVRSPSSYLVANNASGLFSFGTGDFTIEAWVYMNSLPSGNGYPDSYWIVGGGPVNQNPGFDIAIGSTNLQVGLTSFASLNINVAHGMSATTWYHIAVVRSGATLYAFRDGVQLATASVSGVTADPCLTGLAISAAEPTGATSGNFNGYIDDLRITKGIARYVQNFTPPTAPFQTS